MKARFLKCIFALKRVYGLQIELNKDLKNLTSFKIGGKAKIFVKPSGLEHFIKCCLIFKKFNIPYAIVGNATNLLIPKFFKGAVLQIASNYQDVEVHGNVIVAKAGALMNKVALTACKNDLKGMEDAFGIPGTVGGAIFMNASAFGFETSKVVSGVLAMVDGKIQEFSNEECEFGYRASVFQKLNNPIILEVNFKLEKLENQSEILLKRAINCFEKRKETQPLSSFSAGSVFKCADGQPAAILIDNCGLKGFEMGGARVSVKHANFIENYNNATFEDVVGLVSHVRRVVFEKYNKKLDVEIKVLGESDDFFFLLCS